MQPLPSRNQISREGSDLLGNPNGSADQGALQQEFRNLWEWMHEGYRYSYSKFGILLNDKWPAVRAIVTGETALSRPSHVEIHPSEPCQLNCKYCRGELRQVPERQKIMAREDLLRLIEDIHELNPTTFIRFSGTIGEPLLHPDIAEAFAKIKRLGTLRWGLTTNGLLLHKERLLELLMAANYVHVSLDAGTDLTYQQLKAGRSGDFERVLENVKALAELKVLSKSKVEIVVSFVIQDENYREISQISRRLKEIGVGVFELKMQHFDPRRHMTPESVHEAYELIKRVQAEDDCASYRVVVVQSEDIAVSKIRGNRSLIDFPRCFANQLGLNATIDPRGNLQTCCQYYQRTLGAQGQVSDGLSQLWTSQKRTEMLQQDPRNSCINCSPSDEFVNRFVAFLCKAHREDSSFLSWVEENFVGKLSCAEENAG